MSTGSEKRVPFNTRMTPTTIARVKALADAAGQSAADIIADAMGPYLDRAEAKVAKAQARAEELERRKSLAGAKARKPKAK